MRGRTGETQRLGEGGGVVLNIFVSIAVVISTLESCACTFSLHSISELQILLNSETKHLNISCDPTTIN